jgi:Mu transposase, C-terminal domain
MVTDRQVRRLMSLCQTERSLQAAADKVGMNRETARKYRKSGQLPSEVRPDHDWRTRPDGFAEVWPWVAQQLSLNPGLEAKTLLEALQREHPGQFADGQLRTLQRQVKRWRGLEGPGKEVFFAQVHHPGRLGQSDFSHMTKLGVTIGGRSFEHLVYHFVLTYSNWETCTICYSESFESLSEGLQNALWELGGVPQRHRTDCLSAAVANTSNLDEFTRRYQGLLEHYALLPEKTNPNSGNENGDVEQRHHRFKRAVDQALMLRGSRDFADVPAYRQFLQSLTQQLNRGRQSRFAEELKVIHGLPPVRLEAMKRLEARVDCGSLIHVDRNAYSVSSRLIGQQVEVRLYVGHLEVWYGQKKVEELPRLRGRNQHRVNYRHVIDWLVRKSGAFAEYRYQADLFPSSLFRVAYDQLKSQCSGSADKQYLKILELAARESQSLVESAIGRLCDLSQSMSFEAVEAWVLCGQRPAAPTAVRVDEVDLSAYDQLLEGQAAPAGLGVNHE